MDYHNFPVDVKCVSPYLTDGYYALPIKGLRSTPEAIVHGDTLPEGWVFLADDHDDANRILAMRIFKDDFTEAVVSCSEKEVFFQNEDWFVVTDSEADRMDESFLEQDLDDELQQLSDFTQSCIDREKWMRWRHIDHRMNRLARFNGLEHIADLDGDRYFLYRLS
jgi:hypothetical protein